MKSSRRYTSELGVACILTLVGAFGAPHRAAAQEATDSLRLQIARLAVLVDSLSREVERLQSVGQQEDAEDALASLRAAAAAAAAAGGAPAPAEEEQTFVGRQRSLQSLNPEISLNADMLAQFSPDDPGGDNFIPRDFELSIQSSLDPFSRAKIFIIQDTPGGELEPFADPAEEGGAEESGGFFVEEGYVEWVSLPGGLGVKFGRFFQRFGTMNRWHIHALPFESRSLPHIAFFGQGPLSQKGVSVTWLAPFGGGGRGTYEATAEITRAENDIFGEATSSTFLGNINGFWTLGEASDLDLSVSWLNGDFEDPAESFTRNVYSVEMSFNWTPPSRSRRRSLMVRGGYMLLDGLNGQGVAAPAGNAGRETASGFWSMAEVRLSPTWLIGARFDRVQNPADPDVTQWLASPTLTWWQSEYVRIRAEYDFLSGIEGGDGSGRFVLQTTFAMGPHKHSTY